MIYQMHFGANYETGEYGWTSNLAKVKKQIDWQLKEFPGIRWRRITTRHWKNMLPTVSPAVTAISAVRSMPYRREE